MYKGYAFEMSAGDGYFDGYSSKILNFTPVEMDI
jgi:hypothetical protein